MHVVNQAIAKCVLAEGVGAKFRGLGRSGWVQAMGDEHHGDDFCGRREWGHLELGEKGLCSFICHQGLRVCKMTWHEGLTHDANLAQGVDGQQSTGGGEDDILLGNGITVKPSNFELPVVYSVPRASCNSCICNGCFAWVTQRSAISPTRALSGFMCLMRSTAFLYKVLISVSWVSAACFSSMTVSHSSNALTCNAAMRKLFTMGETLDKLETENTHIPGHLFRIVTAMSRTRLSSAPDMVSCKSALLSKLDTTKFSMSSSLASTDWVTADGRFLK